MTDYEFIKKAREMHGYKYIYPSLPEKITYKDRIDILHNDILYNQSVSKHLIGRSPEKNTNRKTTEQFIKESKKVWGDKYDYSLVKYTGALNKVKIIYEGVIFEQIPISHISGLAPEGKWNREYFIKLAKEKWSNKYDYSLVDYKDSKEKVKIIYKKTGEIFEQAPSLHLMHAPEKLLTRKTTEQFISEAEIVHEYKFDYSKTNYIKNQIKVIITCPTHGDFEQTPLSHLQGNGCKKCAMELTNKTNLKHTLKYSTEGFIAEAMSIWGDKYDYSLVEYKNIRTKIKIIHDNIIYEQTPGKHLKYPPERFLNQEIFLIKAKRKWGDKYDYSLVDYISTKETIKIIHNGTVYEQLPHNHLVYAPELRNKLTQEDFIIRSNEIHNNKYSYDKVEYKSDRKKVIITCPLHGDFKQTPSVHLRGSGCKRCSESFGEKEISKFLDKNGIIYEREYRFNDCRNIYPLKFDFYLPSMRICIEFDGIQHYQPVEYFGGLKAYEILKSNDKIKENYCEENFIDLIRIKYDQIDNIYQILWKNLKNRVL